MKAPSQTNRRIISQLLATSLSFGLFVYFGFHLLQGDMGYFALRGVEQKLAAEQGQYEGLLAERQGLERRVRLLRPGSLDLDMLDERARVVLDYAGPDERLILEK